MRKLYELLELTLDAFNDHDKYSMEYCYGLCTVINCLIKYRYIIEDEFRLLDDYLAINLPELKDDINCDNWGYSWDIDDRISRRAWLVKHIKLTK